MNAPHPQDHIVLSGEEKKISYVEDTKLADAGTFIILKEDHTLGNILRMSLLRDGRVLFAGYRMPHPLENRMLVKIKTRPNSNPTNVLLDSISNLQSEIRGLEDSFKRQVAERAAQRTALDYNM
jgi:DNA-directed RNA polymerase II subunit RPB11